MTSAGNILALDPGTAHLGWAVVAPRTGRVIELGVVAQFVARVKACTRPLELGAAHVVVAFALLRGELPRGGAR